MKFYDYGLLWGALFERPRRPCGTSLEYSPEDAKEIAKQPSFGFGSLGELKRNPDELKLYKGI